MSKSFVYALIKLSFLFPRNFPLTTHRGNETAKGASARKKIAAPAIGRRASAAEPVGQLLDFFVEFAAEKVGAHLVHLRDVLELIAEHA